MVTCCEETVDKAGLVVLATSCVSHDVNQSVTAYTDGQMITITHVHMLNMILG